MNIRGFSFLLVIVYALFAYSCASTSKTTSEKSEAAKTFTASDDKGTVYLYRTGRAVGAAGQLSVRVNSTTAGGTGPGTFFKWDLKPGSYTFASSSAESSAVIQIDVKAGQVYYIRQDARMGLSSGRITMKEVDSSQGESEVKKCKLLISSYVPE